MTSARILGLKMKTINDFLTPEEKERYEQGWKEFGDKFTLNTEHDTHSGLPVISQVYQFGDKPVFRAHVFQRSLRKIDPYFICQIYPHPFWNVAHYLMCMEQIYQASMERISENLRLQSKENPEEIKLSEPIYWSDNISVEFILEKRRQTERCSIEDCFFAFYDDKARKIKSRIFCRSFREPRAYVRDIEAIKQGNQEVMVRLARKIRIREQMLEKLLTPRQHLQVSADELITRLQAGEIPEAELDDFFSFWDKPE